MQRTWIPTLALVTLLVIVFVIDGAQPTASPEASALADFRAGYGAVGDGAADDSAALQRAVNSGIGHLVIPKGTYRITRSIVIDLDRVGYVAISGNGVAKIVMDGPGPAFRFIGTHFRSADPEGFSDAVWDRQRMPLVDGVAIVGKHAEAVGIEASGTMQMTLTRLHLRKLHHGIHLVNNNRNVIVSDCHIYENSGVGIYYDDVNLHQSNIVGCHISYNGGGGIVSRAGNVRNIHISGCDLESNMSPNRPATANVLIDCSASQHGTAEVAITGCTIQHNHRAAGSANVRIIGRSNPNPSGGPVREGHVTMTGNVLSDVNVNIDLQACRGVILEGNTCWQGYEQNLVIDECSNVVVGPNLFDRNPRYHYGDAASSRNGLIVRNSTDCTFTGLHINGARQQPAALVIEDCQRINLTNSTILDSDHCGLSLRRVRHGRVSDCLIRDDRPDASSRPVELIDCVDVHHDS